MANEKREVGRVVIVKMAYAWGLIVTDAREQLFFHKRDTVKRTMPENGTLMQFDRVRVDIEGKRDRAINVEAIQ